jgi:hypothetical protein
LYEHGQEEKDHKDPPNIGPMSQSDLRFNIARVGHCRIATFLHIAVGDWVPLARRKSSRFSELLEQLVLLSPSLIEPYLKLFLVV